MKQDQFSPHEATVAVSPMVSSSKISLLMTIWAVWGPGLLVMLADTDAGNIVTAAESGSRWGYRLLPLLILLVPVLVIVQDLALRIGIFRQCGFGELVRNHCGKPGTYLAATALVVATLGSLVTELTGIAGVGELFGASRWVVVPLTTATLVLVVLTGGYRRVERIALLFGFFEISFFIVAWQAHPTTESIVSDALDQKWAALPYLYILAGLIGATFNPWMIFYQSSAVAKKGLTIADYRVARWDTILGAILTQLVTASVLVAVAALRRNDPGTSLETIGEISGVVTPLLGDTMGRVVFGAGVVGAAMAAAIVSSLACAWGVGEIFGLKRSRDTETPHNVPYLVSYAVCIIGSAVLVLLVSDLVWLSVSMQVLNAVLLPVVVGLLVVLAATVLPDGVRLRGWPLWLTAGVVGIVSFAGLAGALAGFL